MSVAPWVKAFVQDIIGTSPLEVNKITRHPVHGRVIILSGQFWGTYGLSNYWTWRKVNKLGVPYGETYRGYGW